MAATPQNTSPPSIRDVAKQAGVSYQTVSRVLNDSPRVRTDTRERVLAAMAALNFRPNRAARMLATSRSNLIGLVATIDGAYYGPTSSISAIEDAAREAGYALLLASPERMDTPRLQEAIEHLIGEGSAGIVVLAPQTRTAEVMSAINTHVPVVVLQSDLQDVDQGLSVDNELGGGIAARHLLGLGHRQVAIVEGPPDWSSESRARTRGYESALDDAGIEIAAIAQGDWTAESGYEAFQLLLKQRRDFTAVFCANDQMALGLIHAAAERDIKIPAQLSVVGFDDVPEAAHYLPPLTTIRQDFPEVGRRAVRTLLGRVTGDTVEYATPIPPRLVVRASTMPVRR